MNPKQIAAERAISYIQDGMAVGLGTGSTAAFAITALAVRLEREPLQLRCVATSHATHELALASGLFLSDPADIKRFDLTIDGADEVDPQFRLIKGGGGALVREKVIAAMTKTEIIIVDDSKVKSALGAHPLPVAILPFAWQWTQEKLSSRFNCPAPLRTLTGNTPFVSDDGLYVLDLAFGLLPSVETLEAEIKRTVGVVEVGLFIGLCQHLIIGYPDGSLDEKTAPSTHA